MTWCTTSAGKPASADDHYSICWRRTRRSPPPSTELLWRSCLIRQSTLGYRAKWLTVSWSDLHRANHPDNDYHSPGHALHLLTGGSEEKCLSILWAPSGSASAPDNPERKETAKWHQRRSTRLRQKRINLRK